MPRKNMRLNRKRNKDAGEAERRLALLALAGERPAPASPCPEAETLAALVEGRLTAPETDACLAHLAACESCYALWLQLDREWRDQRPDRQRKGVLLRLTGRPRALPVAGSLLAAAASIALVLTLTTQADRARLPHPAEQSGSEQAMPAPSHTPAEDRAAPQAEPPPKQQDYLAPAQEQPRPPAKPADTVARAKAKTGAVAETQDGEELRKAAPPAAVEAKKREGKEEATDAAPLAEAESKATDAARQQQQAAPLPAPPRTPAQPAAAPPQAMREKAPVTAEAWYERIRQGCRAVPQADFFTAIAAQGKRLLQESPALSGQDRQRIERLVAELGQDRSAAGQCAALLKLLQSAEQGPRR